MVGQVANLPLRSKIRQAGWQPAPPSRRCANSSSDWLRKGCSVIPIPRPLALLAELTYRCPLKCPSCSNPLELNRYRQELDTATWQRVLAEAAALGVVQVHFSGGEPLVRQDLPELLKCARALELYT